MKPILTVGELKKLLVDVPDDYDVFSEGCDCEGEAEGILVEGPYTWWRESEQRPGRVLVQRR